MNELIKRQDAIDAVAKAYRYESDRMTALQDIPTVTEEEIRNKAMMELAKEIKNTLPYAVHRDCSEIDYEIESALYSMRGKIDRFVVKLTQSEKSDSSVPQEKKRVPIIDRNSLNDYWDD